ncbi:hypothetical protein AAZX31_13G340300 [Glycine max]|uniref:Trihelix transcription factor ASIL2 isoform A n=1 Tax=Glycine soja TaxID=3848 RepID=A0A445IF34_GLYSO|nr:trihelix transcription factor ASIL1-like [Glycine soja]KAG4961570.1 hypothetical protein JHK87_038203 [Glycine soja]KHN32602.1 hypothetical protein glysoja_022284 [Glycine soja]RZB84652.1 Trihelix transcription factor ASIL2 isoform A [Glycine soja]RZB84653.1 Trihelix transcription factor ASIL2 isoform B [Glycine soja]
MDGIEDDARYPPNPYGYGYQNSLYSPPVDTEYALDDNDENEEHVQLEGEDEVDVDQSNNLQLPQKDDDEEDGMDGGGDENDDDDEEEAEENKQIDYYPTKSDEDEVEWHPKKQKLKSLISTYELAPRVPAPSVAATAPSVPKPSSGGRNSLTDWTERETFVLLDAWGDRFLQHGRKSLRCEEWQQIAKMVSQVSKIERTDTQCRNRLDTLKKKYKKEKAKFPDSDGGACKWVYFKSMDELMASPPQQAGLSCGVDSGEYVFMNPRVHLNHANGLDEMRDSPDNTESTGEEGSDGPQAKKRKKRRGSGEASSFRLLADSIQKFSKIYEKIENSKRQQMVELEKMRMDFHKELETQKRQILENLQCEISKLEQRNDDNDDSAENGT